MIFHHKVLISEKKPPTESNSDISSSTGNVSIEKYTPNSVLITTDYNTDGWVILTDSYAQGWKAYVDDKPVQIYPANHLFRAIAVKSGKHTVRMTYFPEYLKKGIYVSVITLGIVICLIVYSRHKTKNFSTHKEDGSE